MFDCSGVNAGKSARLYWGSTQAAIGTYTAAETGHGVLEALVCGDGATNAQKIISYSQLGTALDQSTLYLTSTQDTTAAVTIKTTGTTTNAADEVTSHILLVERLR